jgi:predicted esterase
MKTSRIIIALAIATLFVVAPAQAQQVTRVYLLRGLGHLSNFAPLSRDLRSTGAVVRVYGWASWRNAVRDASRHRGDRIVVGGHSQGADRALVAGAALRARGVPVHVVSLDPLCTFPTAAPGLFAVNIWGSTCNGYDGTVPGAKNIYIRDTSHVHYPADAEVRTMFVQATYWN